MITIRGIEYKVIFTDNIGEEREEPYTERRGTEDFYFGLCEYDKQTIKVNNAVSNERVRQALLHEITHAYHFEYYGGHMFNDRDEFLAEFVSVWAQEILNITNEVYKNYLEGDTDG